MKENPYDQESFFLQYSRMDRSVKGLAGAGEWHAFQKMLPDFKGKRLLDLGCGYGWHCHYAIEQGAREAIGIDLSEKMLAEAKRRNPSSHIHYHQMAIEEIDFPPNSFDIVLSSLAFHYIESFSEICRRVNTCLKNGGTFIFSVEHPIFTAYGSQDWFYGEDGQKLHWPVDRYFSEGKRKALFLGESITKYHKTLTTYINSLLENGFVINGLTEPMPDPSMLATVPGMLDELRRPMMLILSAVKKS